MTKLFCVIIEVFLQAQASIFIIIFVLLIVLFFFIPLAGILMIGMATGLFLRAPAVLKSQTELQQEEYLESKIELQPHQKNKETEESKEKKGVIAQWRGLLSNTAISSMTGLNFGYWLVLSGVNMTLLPMILVDPAFGLSPVEVGGVFAGISVVRCSKILNHNVMNLFN